ncbi:MAG: hypothetical protein ABJC33_12765 [Betaproteobacteria bacterium]
MITISGAPREGDRCQVTIEITSGISRWWSAREVSVLQSDCDEAERAELVVAHQWVDMIIEKAASFALAPAVIAGAVPVAA